MGRTNVEAAYRRFVKAGISRPPDSPFQHVQQGWLLGSDGFVDRIKRLVKTPKYHDEAPTARRLSHLEPDIVIKAVADF